MILDLDTGIDDALAIAYALASEECDLIGIVGSYGNILVEDGVQNSLDLLELLGRPDIPVFTGLHTLQLRIALKLCRSAPRSTAKTGSAKSN